MLCLGDRTEDLGSKFGFFCKVTLILGNIVLVNISETRILSLFGRSQFSECGGVKTATEVGVRAIQDHKVIEWNTCWKCRLSEGIDDM
jgi:hypothetical protein